MSLQTRKRIYDFANTTNDYRLSQLDRVIEAAKEHDIKISLALNTSPSEIDLILEMVRFYNERYMIDSVTTTHKFAQIIKSSFPNIPIICSYNEGVWNLNRLTEVLSSGLFHSVVLGGSFIRNIEAFHYVHLCGLSSILLVNNGCSFGCTRFCKDNGDYCYELFSKRQEILGGVENMYALQSLFPEEIHNHFKGNDSVSIFKLSSRPISFREYKDLLESYVSGDSSCYINESSYNYHLYGRLGYFMEYYSQFDYQRILLYKKRIWNKING